MDLNDSVLNLENRKVGILVTQGESSSIISRVFKKAVSVLIRESEF